MKKIIIPIILIILAAADSNSQLAFTNSGNLQIHTGGSVSGLGNFTNTSAGALVNNGSLYIRGNVTNDQASMATGTGTLYFNGSTAQNLGGTQSFKTFNLVTNNAAGITLNANLSVSGSHTFTNGLITTSITPDYLIYEAGSSYSGNNDSRHVNGWVKKIGNTNFIFPVGDATYERPAALANISAASEFDCKYNTPTSNTSNLSSPLVQVKGNEYWQIDKISGGNAQVTLNWNHAKVPMDNVLVTDILVANYSGGNWVSRGGVASGNVATTGTITSGLIGTFGPFTLGYTTYPIPLKLLSFTAERRPGISYLKWSTENEYNVDHFDVQRSYNGAIYQTIGNVAARNTSSLQHYFFEDHSTLNGLAYYRIKSIDIDGKFSYSNIVVLSESNLYSGGIVVLNPAHDNITILNRSGNGGLFAYRLFNSGGQLVSSGNVTMSINGGAVLPVPPGTTGTCILEMSQGLVSFRQKILMQ
ncbi:MAG: hypothetical protein HOP10_13395 [Chitinophagaceae bacterium]|nr:hypothetical protein [Chitinophagaceae bacterium]